MTRTRILITSLVSLLWVSWASAQSSKSALPKTTALAKAFRANASQTENIETLRRTLGVSPNVAFVWTAGITGQDTISVTDDFNRTDLGNDWAYDPSFWEIKNGELVLTPFANREWRYLAIYKPIYNNLERKVHSVSYRWGKNVDALGIREGAHAIMMDQPSHLSTGYWIWHRTNFEQVWMWIIKDGTWEAGINADDGSPDGIEIDRADAQTDNPVAGDVVTVVIRSQSDANYFDYYINNRFDATVKDAQKRFPTNNSILWYAGVFIHGEQLNNQVDDFKITWLQDDVFTPATVQDLSVTSTTLTSITLEWTAPGDNGFDGRAKSYDLRYSVDRILSDDDFTKATPVPDPIAPGGGGQTEQLVINGLESGKKYYFALKTSDEAGNVSNLSNEVSAKVPALSLVSDSFNRANGNLGSNWSGDLADVQIRNNSAQNINAVSGWGTVVYQTTRNVIEASLKYASTATVKGASASGILVLAEAPTDAANGYLIQRDNGEASNPSDDFTKLWIVRNGQPDELIEEGLSQSGISPKAGSVLKVRIIESNGQRDFYVYVDGVFDRVLTDSRKTFNGLYAGFMLEGGAGEQNAIDEFAAGAAPGKAKALSLVSGDGQFGEINKLLPQPLTVALIDSFNNPLTAVFVRFAVTAGIASVQLPPSPDGNLRLEGEDALISGPIQRVKEANAAAGQYIVYPKGQTQDASATFTFEIKQAGVYRVWTRSLKPSLPAGSWNVQIDNGTAFVYDVFRNTTHGNWKWELLADRGTGDAAKPQFDPKIINFIAGEHKLIFNARFDDTRLDKIIITSDLGFTPDGLEESGFLTDATGRASASVKLGGTLQPVTIEASHSSLNPILFKATPLSNEKPQTIAAVGSTSASGGAGQQVPFKIVLKDKNGNGVAGQQVSWVVTAGNGSLNQYAISTDLNGEAQVTLTLGNIAATNTIEARAVGVNGITLKAVFIATTTSGLAANSALVSGNNQSAIVHAKLPNPLVLKVTSSTGQTVSNFPVDVKNIRGGGSLSSIIVINNESFEAAHNGLNVPANWDLEGAPGSGEVALSTAGPRSGAKSLQVNASHDGVGVLQTLNYSATGDYTLSFYVKVTSGVARVVWGLNAGNGALVEKIIDITALATGSNWTLYTIAANNGSALPRKLTIKTSGSGNFFIDDVKIFRNTDNNGQISVNWTLGDTAMTQVVRAEVPPSGIGNTKLAGSPITFSATATAGPAKKVVAFNGNNQNGAPNQQLSSPLVAKVSDDGVNGIAGRSVTFTVKSGEAKFTNNLASVTATSDANGLANANLKLGPTANGTIIVEATSAGLLSATFNAIVGVPNQVTKIAGPPTVGSAGIRLAKPLSVRVADVAGKPISGYPVTFTVVQGGGSVKNPVLTDANGEAKAFPVLGTIAGAQNKFQAQVIYNNQPLPAQPIAFVVRASGLKTLSSISGTNQTGNTCEPLAQPFKIKIVDSLDTGVKGQIVKFNVTAGGGNFNGTITKEVPTDSLGIAAATLILGEKAGATQVSASITPALPGSPQTFTATGKLGLASTLRKISKDTLAGQVNMNLSTPLVVRVTDKCTANGIATIAVTFIVKAGGGKVNGKDTVTVNSNAQGQAQVNWTLGPLLGNYNNKVEARAAINNLPLENSPALFVANSTAGNARSMNILAGHQQKGRAGDALPNPLVVRVIDGTNGLGNPVAGHRVRFTITRGGGKFSTGSKDSTVTTDAKGVAKVFWTLGGAIGTSGQEVRATATNNTGGNLENSPLVFTANVTGAEPSADGAEFKIESSTPVPADGATKCKATVFVRDRFHNPVQSVAITFLASGGPNFIEQPSAPTDSLGRASCFFSSTRAELKTVTAKIIGGIELSRGATVVFTPTAASAISLVSGNGQDCNVNAAAPSPLKVKVGDKFGNGVPDHLVQFSVKGDGRVGELTSSRILESGPIKTDANGFASATYVAGATKGQVQIWAEAKGANNAVLNNSPVIFVMTVTSTPAQRLVEVSGKGQSGAVLQILPGPLVARVTDGFARPVFGVPVQVSVTFGGGTVNERSVITLNSNELGEVRATWRLGSTAGINTVRFEANGLIGSPLDFRAEAGSDVATILTGLNCGSVSGPVNGTAAAPLQARATDNGGNGVDNIDVLFELIAGTGFFSGPNQARVLQVKTQNGGLASAPITFGSESGYRLVRVSSEGLRGSPLVCRVYGRSLAAQTMEAVARTNDQRGTKNKLLNFPLQVLVKDRLGNPVPNETISFLITAGGGDFNGATPFLAKTDSQGLASAEWKLGGFSEANEALAVRNGLLPSNIIFKATGVNNNFPVFNDAADRRATESDVIAFPVAATDVDGDPIKYGVKNLPTGAQFDSLGTQVFRWPTEPNSRGRYAVSFFARDNKGGADEEVVIIDITKRNQAPQIFSRTPAGNIPNRADTTLSIINGAGTMLMRVNANDADGDLLSYRWFVNGKYAGSAINTFFFKSADRFSTVEAWVFDQEDTTKTSWIVKVPVQLSGFSAALESNASSGKSVRLQWSTGGESNNLGFNVLRSGANAGRYEKINQDLISPRSDGQYLFVDNAVEAGVRYFYKLQDVDLNGNVTEHGPVTIDIAAPQTYVLQQNYPNPFSSGARSPANGRNPTTELRYELPKAGHVRLTIFNALGQEVKRLVDQQQPAGYHRVTWNGRDQRDKLAPSGIYHYRLEFEGLVAMRKMLLTK